MSNRPIPLAEPADLGRALGLLTRLPVRVDAARAGARGAAAGWAWPVAGALVGGISALIGSLALGIGATPGIAAGLALGAGIVLTGALHEDGLADCADGFWGGFDRARRLEIMADSRIGSYGVLALGLSLILRWSALSALFAAGHVGGPLIAAGALARMALPWIMHRLPNARGGGLSAQVGRPAPETAVLAAVLGAALALFATGPAGAAALIAAAVAAWIATRIAAAKIGGQTGDVLGGAAQLAEVAALAVLAAVLPG